MSRTVRRVLIALAKLAVLAVVVWAGHRTIVRAVDDLDRQGWHFDQLHPAWAVLCGLLYLLSQLPSGLFWRDILHSLGQNVSTARALRAYFIGHLGKYVPGKAMVAVLRSGLVYGPGVKPLLAVVAVMYETMTTMACGAVLAACILLAGFREHGWLILGSLGLAVLVGLPTLPSAFSRLLRMLRVARSDPNLTGEPFRLPGEVLLRGWLSIATGWVAGGLSMWAAVRAIGVSDVGVLADLPIFTATVALAVVLGFVSMLPAGLGVRDIALMQLLAPRLGDAQAVVAVIVLRLVSLLAEIALSAVLYPLGRRWAQAVPEPPHPEQR